MPNLQRIISFRTIPLLLVCHGYLLAVQIVIGSSVVAQGPQLTPPASSTPPDQRCVLQGHVTNSLTGEPLKKATVRVTRRGSGVPGTMMMSGPIMAGSMGGQGYSATSEADGSFRIEGMEPGDYMLSGQRMGFLNTNYGAKSPMHAGTTLTLRPGQQMTDVNLALIPQAVISGKVLDEDGDPLPGTMIEVLGQMWQRGKLRYMPHGGNPANDLGEFRIANLSPGKYFLCAQRMNFAMQNDLPPTPGKPDVRPVRTCYPEATSVETATPIQVKAGQDLSGTDIRLHSAATYHIRGKVAGSLPDSQSERITVNLAQGDSFFGFMGGQAMVGKDRTFDISGVSPGSYVLTLLVMGGPVRSLNHQPVDVGSGDVNDLMLTITPPGSLQGQIHLEGTPPAGANAVNMANIRVRLTSADSVMVFAPLPNVTAKADGTLSAENVSPGKYYVQVNAPSGTYLKSVRFGQEEVLGKELDFQGGSGDLTVVFRYGPAEVDGSVQAAQTQTAPVPAGSSSSGQSASPITASVVLVPDTLNADGSGIHFGSVDQSGTFTIKQLPPGHYRAYAFEEANTGQLENPDILKQLESKATVVEVKENDKKQIQLPLISADDFQQILARLGIDSQ